MKAFKHIIFDLGGVIINLDYQATVRAFSELCGRDMTEAYGKHKQAPLFDDIETGKISPADFREGLRNIFEIQASDEEIDLAWNKMLLDIPQERIDFLKEIGKQHRIFLLSNTNAIHKEAFEAILQQSSGLEKLDVLFEKCYYSHETDDRKPHPSIFEMVLKENGLEASETLFIDDSIQHIEGANSVGLQTIHLEAPTTVLDLGLM